MTFRAAGLALVLAVSAAPSAQERPSLDALVTRVEEAPQDAQARRQLAARYTEAGRPEAAVTHLVWLADAQPRDAEVLRQLAQHLLWTDEPSRAADVLSRLVEVDPDDDEARVRLAELIVWEGQARRAADLLAPIAAERPDDPRIQRAYAFALLAADDAGAREQLDAAVQLLPHDPELLLESGAVERWQGDWALGRKRLERARSAGLSPQGDARAAALLSGISSLVDPTLTTRVALTDDSNGVGRLDAPVRLDVLLSPTLQVGVEANGDRITTIGGGEAAGTVGAAPFVAWMPSSTVRLELGAGLESSDGSVGPVVRARAQKSWTGARFALVRATLDSRAATDAASALAGGVRRTTAQFEGYAEPVRSLTLFGDAAAHRYSDSNLRVHAAATARWLPIRVGQTGPRPGVALGPAATLMYDDTQTVYPTSQPYYTPAELWTGSLGLAATAAPTTRVRFEGALGLARQSGSFAATSLEFGGAIDIDLGRHAVRVEARRSGSSAYAADVVALSARIRLP
ncbi:tetratricopeptide repeat protein [Rubrivirga sp. IMCC43871]|uniref:tetratricopeptide repeat protein n=1 Tax=Rubrivirga sp. IMCC43871 TaxID=3391575 RepID=UPI00399012C2